MNIALTLLLEALQELPDDIQADYASRFLAEIERQEALDDAQWDETLASPESQRLLDHIAEKVEKNIESGKVQPIEDLFKRLPGV